MSSPVRHHRQQARARAPWSRRCPWPTSGSAPRRSRRRQCPAAAEACSPSRPPRPARRAAGTPSRAAPARPPCLGGSDAVTGDGVVVAAHRMPALDVTAASSLDPGLRLGGRRLPPTRLRNWRLVTIVTAKSENDALPPAVAMASTSAAIGAPDGSSERVADHLLRERRHHLRVLLLQVSSGDPRCRRWWSCPRTHR